MKKVLMSLIILTLVFSFGLAYAEGPKLPQYILDQHAAQGTDATYVIWFPFVPDTATWHWSTYIVLSNFYSFPVTLNVWATAEEEAPTLKMVTLDGFEKKIITLSFFGIFDTFADVYISSSDFFGAAALLFDSNTLLVQTAFPPIFLYY